MLRLFTILIASLILSFGSVAQRIEKSRSYYYLNDSTRVADSMLVNTRFYNKKGGLYKVEEDFYKNSKITRHYIGNFKNTDTIIDMYCNGKLEMKLSYDSNGTVIKHWARINNDKDTMVIHYTPYYELGKLVQRNVLHNGSRSIEYYQYLFYPDSSIITNKDFMANNLGYETDLFSVNKKCISKKFNKLLYEETHFLASGDKTISNYQYDDLGNILSHTESKNGKVILTETYYYKFGKKSYRIKKKENETIFIKTFYD